MKFLYKASVIGNWLLMSVHLIQIIILVDLNGFVRFTRIEGFMNAATDYRVLKDLLINIHLERTLC